MASGMKWNGKEFERLIKNATGQGLVRAGTFYQMKCQVAVSRPNTGRSLPVKRKRPGGNKRTRTVYPNPSKPGESPRLRTGFGRKNIVANHNPGKLYSRVGVPKNAMYMFYLEIGTRQIQRRPWLLKTLIENQETIGRLACTGK